MEKLDWQDRVTIDPEVCHGKPCIRGTRIMVSIILDYLKAGHNSQQILVEYPGLEDADIRAALAYAAWLAHEEEMQPLHTENLVRGLTRGAHTSDGYGPKLVDL